MAISFGFFDAQDGDRAYSSADFNAVTQGLYTNGIAAGYGVADAQLSIAATGTSYQVSVAAGLYLYNGCWWKNTASFNHTIASSLNPTLSAIIRYDASGRQLYFDVINSSDVNLSTDGVLATLTKTSAGVITVVSQKREYARLAKQILLPQSVMSEDISDGAIISSKIAPGAVTLDKINGAHVISVGTNGTEWKNFVRYNNNRWEGDFLTDMSTRNLYFTVTVLYTIADLVRYGITDAQKVAFPPEKHVITGLGSVGIQAKGAASVPPAQIGFVYPPTSFSSWVNGFYTDSCSLSTIYAQDVDHRGSWLITGAVLRGHAYGTWTE